MLINEQLEKMNMTKYRLSKESGVPQATINDICNGKADLEKCTAGTLYRLAKVLGISIEEILQSAETEYRCAFETFKSNTCHHVKDMGDLDFTAEAPHTVFDPAQRLARFRQELADPEVGLIAMDIILGPGVAPDPATCYIEDMKARPDVNFICAVCGGEGDPQNKRAIQKKLREAGVIVADSNYESAKLSAKILRRLR